MPHLDGLIRDYERTVNLPWNTRLAGPQKVWMAIYTPSDERRLRARLLEFEGATRKAGHQWQSYDVTDEFARWMATHEYRESYFDSPEDLTPDALVDFDKYLVERLRATLTQPSVDETTVVAIWGVASLFGVTHVSKLIEYVNEHIRGRLLIFFPGERDGSNYRLLDARDGWNYLATPISAQEGTTA